MTPEVDILTTVEVVGRGSKKLLQAINELGRLGVENLQIDIPRIVAIGDQSAGKSSIIEAISEIKVPRSTGTCTRCPIHINLSEDDEETSLWNCKVSLQKHFDYFGDPKPRRSRIAPGEYPGWIQKETPTTIEFARTTNKDELEEILKRAQIAVLNPQCDPLDFRNENIEKAEYDHPNQVEFSPNTIEIEITGPRLPTLSFVDLPGVIAQTATGRNSHLPQLVQNLVKNYISAENSLVLLACPLEGDIANSRASGLVREIEAESRCIGILTKPDRLPQGDPIDLWKCILKGDKYRLGHGYFVTKQPSQAEIREVDYARARMDERAFFDTQSPWSTELVEFRDRFGTEALQEVLSKKLAVQILASLPLIKSQIRQKLTDIDEELSAFPEPRVADAVYPVMTAISNFASLLSNSLEGMGPSNIFKNKWHGLRKAFFKEIYDLRPKLKVVAPEDHIAQELKQAVVRMEEPIVVDSDNDGTAHGRNLQITPKKRRLQEEGGVDTESPTPRTARTRVTLEGSNPDSSGISFEIDTIYRTIREFCTSDIPNETDPRAIEHLILTCLEQWDAPVSKLLNEVEERIKELCSQAFSEAFGNYRLTDLWGRSWEVADKFLAIRIGMARDHAIPRELRLERFKPITVNEANWEENRQKELQVFQDARYRSRAEAFFIRRSHAIGKKWSEQDMKRKIQNEESIRKELGPDPHELVVNTMAKLRGYYNIASNRFVDNVCKIIQGELFKSIKEELHTALVTELNAVNQESCAKLLIEDQERERRRETLKARKVQLLAARRCLEKLDLKYQDGAQESQYSASDTTADYSPPSPAVLADRSRSRSVMNHFGEEQDMDLA